jgi:hypothetical protein
MTEFSLGGLESLNKTWAYLQPPKDEGGPPPAAQTLFFVSCYWRELEELAFLHSSREATVA